MNNNIENLVKNVIEENIVKFKEDTSKVLYNKVGDRLKDEYVHVSRKLFKNINEAAISGVAALDAPEAFEKNWASAAPPGGSPGGQQRPENPDEWPDPGPPPKNPYPDGAPSRPMRSDYPEGPKGDEQFKQAMYAYERAIRDILEYQKKYKEWRRAYDRWRNRTPTRGPGAPRPPKPKKDSN